MSIKSYQINKYQLLIVHLQKLFLKIINPKINKNKLCEKSFNIYPPKSPPISIPINLSTVSNITISVENPTILKANIFLL